VPPTAADPRPTRGRPRQRAATAMTTRTCPAHDRLAQIEKETHELRARVEQLGTIVAELQAIVAELVAHTGPRDGADRALFLGIIEVTDGQWFTLGTVAQDPALLHLLQAAEMDSPQELGLLLHRLWQRPPEGPYRLLRGPRGRGGRRWRCVMCVDA
jgi:hypothetical protein